MFSTGDLNPQASGTASIGTQQTGRFGQKMPPTPYANIHMNSGMWHDALYGQSGIIRYSMKPDLSYRETHDSEVSYHVAGTQTAFEFSVDGGFNFPLRLGATRALDVDDQESGSTFKQIAIISTQKHPADDLFIVSSGEMQIITGHGLSINTFGGLQEALGIGLKIDSFRAIDIDTAGFFLVDATGQIELDSDDNITLNARGLNKGTLTYFGFGDAGSPHNAWYVRDNNKVSGGPLAIGLWPIPHSGQIATMIAQATPGGSVDLQTAYDNGNEIDHRRDLIGYKGILVRETIPGFDGGFTTNADISSNKPGKYGIAVSGHTLTPTVPNSYGFAALNSLSLVIASSGSVSTLSRSFFLGYAASNASTVFFNTDGTLQFAVGDNTGAGTGGQISVRPFGGSGRLEYRFGPHQAWAERLTHASVGGPANDGFWPIPHSGQILEQIVRREKSKSMTIERPAVNNDLTWFYANQAITITEVESVVRGAFDASGSFAIRYGPNRNLAGTELTSSTISCSNRTTGQITTSFAAANIPVDNWVWIGVSGVSGVPTAQLHVTIHYN